MKCKQAGVLIKSNIDSANQRRAIAGAACLYASQLWSCSNVAARNVAENMLGYVLAQHNYARLHFTKTGWQLETTLTEPIIITASHSEHNIRPMTDTTVSI